MDVTVATLAAADISSYINVADLFFLKITTTVAVDLHYEEGRHYEVNVTFML